MKLRLLTAWAIALTMLLAQFPGTSIFAAPTVSADSYSSASTVLDADKTVGLLELNPTNLSGPAVDLYKTLSDSFADEFSNGTHDSTAENTSDEVVSYLKEKLSKTPITRAGIYKDDSKNPSSVYAVALFPLSEPEFQINIVDQLTKVKGFSSSAYNNSTIYRLNSLYADGIDADGNLTYTASEYALIEFTYLNGFVISSQDGNTSLKMLIDTTSPLSTSENFKTTIKNLDTKAGVTLYAQAEEFTADITKSLSQLDGDSSELTDQLEILTAMKTIGASLTQSSSGLKLKTYLVQNPDKITSLGYDYSDIPTPSLYKYMPKANPILLFDSATSEKNKEKAVSTFTEILKKNFGNVDKKNDDLIATITETLSNTILPAINNEAAILFQNSGQIIPSITMMVKVDDEEGNIQELLTTAVDSLWNSLNNNNSIKLSNGNLILKNNGITTTAQKGTVSIGGKDMDQFTFTTTLKTSKNPYAVKWSKDSLKFALTMGITKDNVLLVSTNKDIGTTYGEGLDTNQDIKTLFSEDIDSLTYINGKNLAKYVEDILSVMEKSASVKTEAGQTKELIKAIANALGKITVASKTTNSYAKSTIEISLDLGDVEGLISKFSNLNKNGIFNTIGNSSKEFNDVTADNWYGDSVYFMSTKGIFNGYPDGTFKADNKVTKAEFLTMLIKTLEQKGLFTMDSVSSYAKEGDYTLFEDVKPFVWYESYVYSAYNLGLAKGFSKELFKPDDKVRRDEAAFIIANTVKKYAKELVTGNTDNPFKDITSKNQYAEDIILLTHNGFLNGVSADKFAPEKTLSRAEAARILRTLFDTL